MRRNAIVFGICITSVLFLFCFQVAQATMMETTYILEIDSIRTAEADVFWDIGDQFQFSIVYDDEGSERHWYSDGVNGIGQFGSGDDTLWSTAPAEPSHIYVSDAVFSFDSNLIDYFSHFDDNTVDNWAYRTQGSTANWNRYLKDGVHVSLTDNGTVTSVGNIQKAYTLGDGGAVGFTSPEISFAIVDSTTRPAEPVPEPATMLLFGTGLAGLAGYRKRKAMKK